MFLFFFCLFFFLLLFFFQAEDGIRDLVRSRGLGDVYKRQAQNQINIENDLKKYFNDNLAKPKEELENDAEKIIRAYDPCMSVSYTHLMLPTSDLV